MLGVSHQVRVLSGTMENLEHSPEAKAESNAAFASGPGLGKSDADNLQRSCLVLAGQRQRQLATAATVSEKSGRPRIPCGGSGKHSALTAAPVLSTRDVPRELNSLKARTALKTLGVLLLL